MFGLLLLVLFFGRVEGLFALGGVDGIASCPTCSCHVEDLLANMILS